MSMRCTGEKCPLKGMLEELQGVVESCTARNCPYRTMPATDDEQPAEQAGTAPEEDKQYSGLFEED